MKVLAVCLGNICRSPIAHGLLQSKVDRYELDWEIDSAGTSGYHNGAQPHQDSMAISLQHSIDISHQRSRKLSISDLDYYDLILVMDSANYQHVKNMATTDLQADKIKLILNYVNPGRNEAVPDPYYVGGFDKVFDMLDKATDEVISAHQAISSND